MSAASDYTKDGRIESQRDGKIMKKGLKFNPKIKPPAKGMLHVVDQEHLVNKSDTSFWFVVDRIKKDIYIDRVMEQ